MPKRKTKPLTVQAQSKKKQARDNSTRRSRRSDPECLRNETARDVSTRRQRYEEDPDYEAEVIARDNSTRRSRRNDSEYLRNETTRDVSTRRQRYEEDPDYEGEVIARNNSTRRSRRNDSEYLRNETTRDVSTRRQRYEEDPDYEAEVIARDNSTRRSRRNDSEYLRNETTRDVSTRRQRYEEDPDYEGEVIARNNSTRRSRRNDSEYLRNETTRDVSTRRQRYEEDPDYEGEVIARNNSTRRSRRSDPECLRNESTRDNTSRKRRREIRPSWNEAFETFKTNVKDGPYHHCYSCDRLFFKTQITKTTREKLLAKPNITEQYLNELVLEELLNDIDYSFCSTCIAYVRKGTFPRLNINRSNLKFPEIPDVIKNLTPLAERCVAARIPFMKIERAGVDKQLKIKSGVVNVPIDVRTTVESIPRPVEESGVIEVSLMRKMEYKNAYMKERIRPAEVWAAARLLVETPIYKELGITLNEDQNALGQTEAEAALETDVDMGEPGEAPENEAALAEIEQLDRHLPEMTLLDSTDAIRFAPGEGETPIPMYMDKYCEELSFPKIWFGHHRGQPPAGVRLSYLDFVNSWISRSDRRAADPTHLLFLYKKCQSIQLTSQANIVLRKSAQTNNITAQQVNNKQFIDNAVNLDSAYRFMSNLTGSPAYFEQQKKNVMATVRQNGSFTFFVTVSAAETRWTELLVILKKTLDKIDITEEEASEMQFEEKARLISSDPITCVKYFNHRLKQLWKTWHAENGPFLEYPITYKYCRIEFQHRGSPHAHQFVTLKDAPQFDPDDPESYGRVTEFIDSIVTTDTDDPDIKDIIYVQRHKCNKHCMRGKKGKEVCRFAFPLLPLDRTTILEPIPDTMVLSAKKKDELKAISKKLLEILNDKPEQYDSVDILLAKLGCSMDDYILAARSNLKSRKVFLKRLPKNCRYNGYNKKILISMRSNMDIQFILDVFQCITYVVDYVNKADKGLSRLLRKCVEDFKRGNASVKSRLASLSKIVYNASETSAQEAAWTRCRIPMCMSTDVTEFIHSGPKSSRQRMLKSNADLKKLEEIDPDSTDIYKKGPIDRYCERPDELEDICLADFIALFTYKAKGRSATTNDDDENAPDVAEEIELPDDEVAEPTDRVEKRVFDLKNGGGTLTRRKRPKIIRYCRFNRHQDEENYFRELCLLFFPFRDEDVEIESKNCKEKFEQNEAAIKINFDKYNASGLDIDSILRQIQEERRQQEEIEANEQHESNDQDDNVDNDFVNVFDFDDNVIQPNAAVEMGLEAPGTDITASRYQVPNMVKDDDYYAMCDSLNPLQRDYLMHIVHHFKTSKEPLYHFVSGGAGVGKSRLINSIFQSVMRIYRSEAGPVDSNEVLLVAYTGMAAHNIGGITCHSAFHLSANGGKTDSGLSPDTANTIACQLRSLKLVIIDEISLLSAEHLDQISNNLKQVFRSTREFAGRSFIVVGDFNQLRPVGGSYAFKPKSAYKKNSITSIVDNPQWGLFSMFELVQKMRQADDLRFAEALDRLALGQTTADDNQLFRSRCFTPATLPDEAKCRLRLMAWNKDVDAYNAERAQLLKNEGAIHHLHSAVDKFVGNYTEAQKKKGRHEMANLTRQNLQGLFPVVEFVVGIRYMISTNIDVSDGLFNGATGVLRFVEISNRKIVAVYIEFEDDTIGAKARSARYGIISANQLPATWTPINKISKSFYTTKAGSIQIVREQFPLVMAEAISIHKSQGRSEKVVTIDTAHGMDRQKYYVACSRATSLNGLHFIGNFVPPKPVDFSKDEVQIELKRLRSNPFVPKFQHLRVVPDNATQIVSYNVQSIRKHIATVVADTVFKNSHIIALQESWAVDNESYNIPDFAEINRNRQVGRPKAFGTINFCKETMEQQIFDQIDIETGDTKDHVEITGFRLGNGLTIINIYNNPSTNIDRLKTALTDISDYIDSSRDIIIVGDFNHPLKPGNQIEQFLSRELRLEFLSPREPTTNAGTTIDGVFGRLEKFKQSIEIYESYASFHKPLIIRIEPL